MGSGGVELDCLFANQISSFDLSGHSAISLDHFQSALDPQREPTWLLSSNSYSDSMCNVFPQLNFQQQIPDQNLASLQPSFAAPIFSAFNHALNSHADPEYLRFGNELNGLLPIFPATHTFEEKMMFMEQGRSSFTNAVNGASILLSRKHGNISKMAKLTAQEIIEAKALAASKSHSEAERRRRCRINTHLATLRNLLPSTTKTDKASLLAEVIKQVKELKRQAAEMSDVDPVPSDVDELRVEIDPSSTDDGLLLRVSICCDDRPGLLSNLIQVLRSLKLQSVKAEMSTLGGRLKIVILLKNGDGSSAKQDSPSLNSVQEALRTVMDRSSSTGMPPLSFGSKRQKLGSENNDLSA
ncbi:hypothetical protein O6H91_11G013800 [Diphasiastrum complanatum]|uniref:Uncharacterized protein n=1 Tax=Diphasiastrum complanatum TaxID=34168 RepID=A0ACC2C6E2_DIPCM|nr:hypothetical protein O6H91_11G013800 [Diphasiastrum complanatum]